MVLAYSANAKLVSSGVDTVLAVDTASTAEGERGGSIGLRWRRLSWRTRSRRTVRLFAWVWGGSRFSGITCMAVSSISYSLMGVFVKLLSVHGIPSSESVMVRCAVIAVLSGISLRKAGHPFLGSKPVRHLVITRALIGYVALSTFFYSIQAMPLRDATVLNFTMPVFTAIFATLFLRERWGFSEMLGSLCSFAGVLLVTQPEFLFGAHMVGHRAVKSGVVEARRNNSWGVLMAMLGASLGALSYIVVRAIGKTGEPPMVSVFAFAALSAPLSVPAVLLQGFRWPSLLEASLLLAVGLTAFAAQVFLTRGLQLEKAARAASIQYIKVLCTYLLGVIFLGEIPSMLGAVGALLIAASAAFMTYGSGT